MGNLIIFEGCDGTGKTTAAKALADRLGFEYIHMDASLHLGPEFLPRAFVDAMMPALLGHVGIVMDRCWYSEKIYADVMREGQDRIGIINTRILDRLALRCNPVIVHCDPGWDLVEKSFLSRSDDEYVDGLDKIREVYKGYRKRRVEYGLLTTDFDYRNDIIQDLYSKISGLLPKFAFIDVENKTSGNPYAETLVCVQDDLQKPSKYCSYRDFAGVQLNPYGLYTGLTCYMDNYKIPEHDLIWCYQSEVNEVLSNYTHVKKIVSLNNGGFIEPTGPASVINLGYEGMANQTFNSSFYESFIDAIGA